jgi:hypothetical protein
MTEPTTTHHVTNMATLERRIYTTESAQAAVVAAYAQGKGDNNTWDYERYWSLIETGKHYVFCGDWACPLEVPS